MFPRFYAPVKAVLLPECALKLLRIEPGLFLIMWLIRRVVSPRHVPHPYRLAVSGRIARGV